MLRKKQNQVTFLHVYHHSGMVFLAWVGSKYFPGKFFSLLLIFLLNNIYFLGGHSVFMGFINSFVHVVMYSYYLASSLSPKYKQNLWWKKYITQLQLVIFIYFFLLFIYLICKNSIIYFSVTIFITYNSLDNTINSTELCISTVTYVSACATKLFYVYIVW